MIFDEHPIFFFVIKKDSIRENIIFHPSEMSTHKLVCFFSKTYGEEFKPWCFSEHFVFSILNMYYGHIHEDNPLLPA